MAKKKNESSKKKTKKSSEKNQKELTSLKEELTAEKEKNLRLIAEFDNLVVNKKEIPQLNEILENYNNNVIKLNSAISFKKFINDMLSYYSG